MGVVADFIKAAETKQAVDPASMLSRLTKLEERASSIPSASSELKSLSKTVPTSEQESTKNALKWLAISGAGAAGLGALLRYVRSRNEGERRQKLMEDIDPYGGAPGRDITIPLPGAKRASLEKAAAGALVPAAIAAATAPAALRTAGSSIGELWEDIKGGTRKGFEHLFAPTGSALDKSWFLPAALAATMGAGYLGYKGLDKRLERSRGERAERTLAKAKKEFEDALKAQYEQSELLEAASKKRPSRSLEAADGGFKFASALGMVADAFAQAHVSGELDAQFATLEKSAQDGEEQPEGFGWQSFKGGGRKALGAYLATLALLGAAGAGAGYSFVKGREKSRRKYDIAKDIMRRRALSTPPTVSVEPA